MLFSLLLIAATVNASSASPKPEVSTESHSCLTMRTYVFSHPPNQHLEKILTCVPSQTYATRSTDLKLVLPVKANEAPDQHAPRRLPAANVLH